MDLPALVVIFVALGLGGLAKGATGMGMPLVAIPIITAFYGLQQAVVILVIPTLVSNSWQIWRFRHVRGEARLKFLFPMLAACALGVVIGTWFLTSAPLRLLEVTLGTLLVGYLALRLGRPHLVLGPEAARRWAGPAGLGSGILHGATGISAPIGVTFIHAMGFSRDAHVFAVSAMFLCLAVVQTPTLAIAGLLDPEWLVQGALAIIPTILFLPVGQWLAEKLSPRAFDRLILGFLGVIGAKMLLGL